ncbi:MAG: hypothetical protein RLZZ516_2611 [Cyanobacteriota bacterium]|jgi:hypothetical protein
MQKLENRRLGIKCDNDRTGLRLQIHISVQQRLSQGIWCKAVNRPEINKTMKDSDKIRLQHLNPQPEERFNNIGAFSRISEGRPALNGTSRTCRCRPAGP